MKQPTIDVVIPAYNEAQSIGNVLADIPRQTVREVVVVSNASTDDTEAVARRGGATVLVEPEKGYGAACLCGLDYLRHKPAGPPDVVVFVDGDYSDYPAQLPEVVAPILQGEADLVIGSRKLGERAAGSMMPQQIFGNWLATSLIRLLYKAEFTDLGPFRAIRWQALEQIGMEDRNYGWTVEMQIKAARQKLRFVEVPVDYRPRIGESKVSGTLRGTIGAGYKILWLIAKYAWR